ncbi:MAG: Holliday junction resolvase RuvX [Nitriliruptorales bacterium]
MRTLGVDLGDVRIGLSLSDPEGRVATPLVTLAVSDPDDVEGTVTALVDAARQHGAGAVVVGLPRSLSGEEREPAQRARLIAERVEQGSGLAVHLWDERLTTVEAERTMLAQGAKRRERRAAADRVAATLLLQTFLDAMHGGEQERGSR